MTDTNLPRKKVYSKIKSNASTFFYKATHKQLKAKIKNLTKQKDFDILTDVFSERIKYEQI